MLGIGGVRDIFHGVRQGIDTFDCVHPSRLGRHGGALVLASYWNEEKHTITPVTAMTLGAQKKAEKMAIKNEMRAKQLNRNVVDDMVLAINSVVSANSEAVIPIPSSKNSVNNSNNVSNDILGKIETVDSFEGESSTLIPPVHSRLSKQERYLKKRMNKLKMVAIRRKPLVREHINVCKGSSEDTFDGFPSMIPDDLTHFLISPITFPFSIVIFSLLLCDYNCSLTFVFTLRSFSYFSTSLSLIIFHLLPYYNPYSPLSLHCPIGPMRNDPRPIDSTCGCYTCTNFSRAYLHHLFKARESLGGTLVNKFYRVEIQYFRKFKCSFFLFNILLIIFVLDLMNR